MSVENHTNVLEPRPATSTASPPRGYDTLGPASHELVLIIVTMLLPTLALAQQQGVVALT